VAELVQTSDLLAFEKRCHMKPRGLVFTIDHAGTVEPANKADKRFLTHEPIITY
jgi:hypothetical protein